MKKEKTYIYIDSFNLYYGFLKSRPKGCKWLNLEGWLSKVFPQNDIQKIKYFTAKVSGKRDPTKPIRQETYLRALKTLPSVEIIEGSFLTKQAKIQITSDVCILAKVLEEKGTDVNLAVHLVNDAHFNRFDTAIVVSNDSDLAEAIKIVTRELKLKVGVLNPYDKFSKQLNKDTTFKMSVREGPIVSSQFLSVMTDKFGTFTKPSSW
jgi:uncharacterized LabA/DUF88 family protein